MKAPKSPPVGTRSVESLMTRKVFYATLDMTVREIIKSLLSNQISGMPVVDSLHKVISVVSQSDLLQFAAVGGLNRKLVDFADKLPSASDVVFVHKNDSFVEVFKKFLTHPVRRVIVV